MKEKKSLHRVDKRKTLGVSKGTASSSTGITDLDDLLGGGFPKESVVLVAGASGSGKSILSYQWLFEGIRKNENGAYITMTEPLFKTLKNLENLSFYDRSAIEQEKIKIIDLRDYKKELGQTDALLDFIEKTVKKTNVRRLCIDSITAIAYTLDDRSKIRNLIFRLGKMLSTLGCTTLLTSEISENSKLSAYGIEEFISDVILKLEQQETVQGFRRLIKIIKVRSRGYKEEVLQFRITDKGINPIPRIKISLDYKTTDEKISIGIPSFDRMLEGGIFRGSSNLIAGSTGTGKSVLSLHFILEGLKKNETCLYCNFEESKDQIMRDASKIGWDLEKYEKQGILIFRCVYPNEKSLYEHMADISEIVEKRNVERCVIDSISSISSSFPERHFMNFAKTMIGFLKSRNVTSFFTSFITSLIGSGSLGENSLPTLTDNILILRYIELDGQLQTIMNIVKVRGSPHSKGLINYNITEKGIVLGQTLSGYEGIMIGTTRKVSMSAEEKLREEFRRFIGPMADTIFLELKNKGISKENVLHYLNGLEKDRIMKKEDMELFRKNIMSILKD